ncbi:MAG: hypothetical protein R3259_14020 [Salinimicrobium sediminis]|nr:hypothetical protein [Salinimicrobium sediminis]
MILLSLLLCSSYSSFSQQTHYSAEVNLHAMGGTEKTLPFWMYSNSRGRFNESTHFAGILSGMAERELYSGGKISAGGSLLFRNGSPEDLVIDEAYLHFENSWLQATTGIKHGEEIYNGLSASNLNMLWSLNARALPGIEFGTSSPLYFNGKNGLGVEMCWGDYYAGSDAYLEHVKIHRKSLHFVLNIENGWFLKGGLLHFAQWGGTAPSATETAFDFQGYFRAITGRQYATPNNHLGSWQGLMRKELENSSIEFFTDLPFESGTGAKLGNLPDGRYGIFWKRNEPEYLLNSLLYEFYTTRSQGGDDYLNHPYYMTGWSYKGKVIATPFFGLSEEEGNISNNNFTAHHIGIGGDLGDYYDPYPYRLLLSYGNNFGTPGVPFPRKATFLTTYFAARLYSNKILLDLHLASDFHNLRSPNHAAGISLKYDFLQQQIR